MVKTFRTIRISDKLVSSCEKFLNTRKAKKLGIETIKDAVEYYTRRGLGSSIYYRLKLHPLQI